MTDNDKLDSFIASYKDLCASVSDEMLDNMVDIPGEILDVARDYMKHGDVNLFFMETHSVIFALALNCPEDFEEVARWWYHHFEGFTELAESMK